MKRRYFLARIERTAKQVGQPCYLLREGRRHEVWQIGDVRIIVPRHQDLNDVTAVGLMRELEVVFGERWWRG